MTITPADLARLAALAALDVSADQLTSLASEVDQIVSYVGQLAALAEAGDQPIAETTAGCRLRADLVRPIPLAGSPADFAPQFVDGFFVVPRSVGPGGE